jgi:uncharacterized protein YegL
VKALPVTPDRYLSSNGGSRRRSGGSRGQAAGFGWQAAVFGGQAAGFGGEAAGLGGQAAGFGGPAAVPGSKERTAIMRQDLTDITLVVDRSGSMQARRKDAQGGINAFIEGQAREPGEALLSLVQFDTEYEVVHSGVPMDAVPEYDLVPRGATALLDAVGRAINETGKRLADMDEAERPGLVIFVITTDGLENSSKEFTKARVKQMIEHQQEKYSWQFTFLGANQDAFAEAGGLGIHDAGVATFAPDKVRRAYQVSSARVSRMRGQSRRGEEVKDAFTDQEREEMM